MRLRERFLVDLEALGKSPIREDQPTGADIRNDPNFEELQAEVGKLSSLSAAGTVDWGKVVQLTSEILGRKSKDILVASYLAVALIYTRKIEGVSVGLKIYRDLLEQYWETLYPAKNRLRARLNAIDWWVERAEIAVSQLGQITLSQDQLGVIKEHLEKIDQFLRQNLEEPPSISAIWDQLEKSFTPAPIPDASPSPIPSPSEKPSLPPSAAPERAIQKEKEPEASGPIGSTQDAQRVLNAGLQKIREGTTYLWQENLSNPLAYRWSRIAAWSTVEALPPAVDGRTRIPAPPTQIGNILSDLKSKGDDESLLKSAEARFPQFIFWFDLNHWVAEALTRLGDRYQRAKEAVEQETGFLIYRFPGLEELSFADGTPFADAGTKKWLKEIVLRIGSGEDRPSLPPEPISRGQEEDVIGKEVKEAQILIKKGKLIEAMEGLQKKFRDSLSQKEKFLWRLALAQLLVDNKETRVALSHLDQILKDIDFYRLEEYDPQLALKGLKVVWHGLHSQSDPASKEKAAETLGRISKLDLAEAIRMGKG